MQSYTTPAEDNLLKEKQLYTSPIMARIYAEKNKSSQSLKVKLKISLALKQKIEQSQLHDRLHTGLGMLWILYQRKINNDNINSIFKS